MIHSKIKEFFGYELILNKKSGQIHNIKNLHKNCNFVSLRSGIYISKRKALKLIERGEAQFCKWCNKKNKIKTYN